MAVLVGVALAAVVSMAMVATQREGDATTDRAKTDDPKLADVTQDLPEEASTTTTRQSTPATVAITTTTAPLASGPVAISGSAQFCVIDTTPLNIRAGAGTEYEVLDAIPIDRCDVYDAASTAETMVSVSGQLWRRITWQRTTGWVADYLIQRQ